MNYIGKELIELTQLVKGIRGKHDQERALKILRSTINRFKPYQKNVDISEVEEFNIFRTDVLKYFCVVNGVKTENVFEKNRTKNIIKAKQMFIYFNKNVCNDVLGDYLNLHRTSVIYQKTKGRQ